MIPVPREDMSGSSTHPQSDSEIVKEIFADACDLPSEQRPDFLDERCGNDEQTRDAVEKLLRAHDSAGRFMSDPPAAMDKATLSERSTPEELPRTVGRFKLVQLLGEGGF